MSTQNIVEQILIDAVRKGFTISLTDCCGHFLVERSTDFGEIECEAASGSTLYFHCASSGDTKRLRAIDLLDRESFQFAELLSSVPDYASSQSQDAKMREEHKCSPMSIETEMLHIFAKYQAMQDYNNTSDRIVIKCLRDFGQDFCFGDFLAFRGEYEEALDELKSASVEEITNQLANIIGSNMPLGVKEDKCVFVKNGSRSGSRLTVDDNCGNSFEIEVRKLETASAL